MTTDIASAAPPPRFRRWPLSAWAGHSVLIALAFLAIFPVYWMVVSSLRAENDIFDTALWPRSWTFENYRFVFKTIPIVRMLWNTTLVSAAVAALQVFTGLTAAFALVRWEFRYSNIAYGLIALTWLVPFQVVMIPNYVAVADLGLLDSLAGLVIPHIAAAFAVMMLFQAMKTFPLQTMEAARIDGAGDWTILWRVIVPNMRSSIASLAILAFISQWNDYFWPLLLSRSIENSVVQIGLQMFMTQEGNLWGPLMAASTLASLPILVVYVALQRHVIDAFMRSGLR